MVFAVAAASFLVSCGVPEGGNKGVLKMEEGVERYDDAAGSHGNGVANAEHKTTVDIDFNGKTLKGFQGGLEEQIIGFLQSDGYKNAVDDTVLKDKWYNFDNVNFKTGSANQLEEGSEAQLDNLANILKAYPDAKIKIGGYTDKTGKEDVNQKISQGRADFIKTELAKKGVGAQVISAEGYGSKFATVPAEASDEERASDRKMAVRFTK